MAEKGNALLEVFELEVSHPRLSDEYARITFYNLATSLKDELRVTLFLILYRHRPHVALQITKALEEYGPEWLQKAKEEIARIPQKRKSPGESIIPVIRNAPSTALPSFAVLVKTAEFSSDELRAIAAVWKERCAGLVFLDAELGVLADLSERLSERL